MHVVASETTRRARLREGAPPVGYNADQERLGINVIKALAMDGPAAAKSGHQGTAMALAPLAHVLFTRVMNYDARP